MTNDELEKKIKKAYDRAVPDEFDSILSDVEKNAGVIKNDKRKRRGKKWIFRAVSMAAAAAAAVAGISIGSVFYSSETAVASTVYLDASPGLDIKVNKDMRVLSVIPENEEAKEIIGTMDLKDTNIKVAVNAILGSMITKGYISDISNSILISVDDPDQAQAKALQNMLMEDIDKVIGGGVLEGAVVGQVIPGEGEVYALASEYGITPGKAQLITHIVENDPTMKVEDLVSLSVNDLNLLRKNTPGIGHIGTASEKAYIGSENAVSIALGDSGFKKTDVKFLKVDFDYEEGKICYHVSFHKPAGDLDYDYDYDISASDGEIISVEKELDNPEVIRYEENTPVKNTEDDAGKAALAFAGKTQDEIYGYEIEADHEGAPHYDIEFKCGGMEYNYSLGMYDDTVFKTKWEKEEGKEDDMFIPSEDEKKNYIGEDQAKAIALKQKGLLEGEIYDLEIELEKSRGRIIYEVEFKAGIYDYSYDIDSTTGEIVDYEIDYAKEHKS